VTWLSVVNWDRYQDIRVDDPFYVKLHICILDDKKVQKLDPHSRLLWYQLLPLAGRYHNALAYNVSAISKEVKLERHTVAKALQNLISVGLLRETKTPRRGGKKPPRRTGWKHVRGSHGGTYKRDPDGIDRPPREFLESMKRRVK
jgi:hypothetical protein